MKRFALLSVLLSTLILMSCSAFAENFPPPGTTSYSMDVTVGATIYDIEGQGIPWYMDDATSTCNMQHGAAGVDGQGFRYIDLNTGPFVATGTWHRMEGTNYGPATLTVSTCPGRMTSLGYPEGDFPADSFFDVFVTLDTPIGHYVTTQAVHLSRESVYGMDYWSVDGGGVPLAGGGPYDFLNMVHFGFGPIPEPSGLLMLATGLVPMGLAVRMRLRRG